MKIGYYLFLGRGDYHAPRELDNKWTCTWSIGEWRRFIDSIIEQGATSILIYLNGHALPYPSRKFKDLVDWDHPNCKEHFLPELFDYIKKRKIELIAVLTTTGHAEAFVSSHPEARIKTSGLDENIENTLISFPEHLRVGKLKKKEGAAQLGLGVLCHNQKISQDYAINILDEISSMYGDFFDGIVFHPPEAAHPCYCDLCKQKFTELNQCEMVDAPLSMAREFFIKSYLDFQNSNLFNFVKSRKPDYKIYTFTIPWFMEEKCEEMLSFIPPQIKIIEWDYNLAPERIESLPFRLKKYASLENDVYFMPTGGFSFDETQEIQSQVDSVKEQITLACEANSKGIFYFLGPKLSKYFLQLSFESLMRMERKCTFR